MPYTRLDGRIIISQTLRLYKFQSLKVFVKGL